MDRDSEIESPRYQPRYWLVTVRVLVVVAMLFIAVGASGMFAFQMCPGCSPYYVPEPQLPEELEKDTNTKSDDPSTGDHHGTQRR
jgi:hypothetical protein